MAPAPLEIPGMQERIAAVLGLGKSGLAAALALKVSGARLWAWDDADDKRAAAAAAGINPIDLRNCDWRKPEFLVLSPGIPHRHPAPHPIAALAQTNRKPIIGDIELLIRAVPEAGYLGITGTNGKSTTTALTGHVLERTGRESAVGGNIGVPALALPRLSAGGLYVLELSSYQLELVPSLACRVAVLLNITPDHIDRHGDMAGYIAAKERIFQRQGAGDTAVVGIDDEPSRILFERLAAPGRQRVVAISARERVLGGVHAVGGRLVDETGGAPVEIVDLNAIATLPGEHNWQNAAACYAACRAVGLAPEAIAAGLATYPGLAHRQELIATIEGVRYVNDSKATNADATAKALACYDPIYWILGGRPKAGGLSGLEPFYPRVVHAYLIGEAAAEFEKQLAGRVPASQCGTLERALEAAHAQAQLEKRRGAVVLLSPACASFDQFANFEARGDTFRRLVGRLAAGQPA
jgi:UDP-N-acetylmuramoylalanine--D-glutamate ligase